MIIEYFLKWIERASVSERVEATNALAKAYLHNSLSSEERDDAEAALTVLLEDPAPKVRMQMAETLADSTKAPRHIILSLAADNTEISTIVHSRSPVFLDAELSAAVAGGDLEQQIAISCRPFLSAEVVSAICNMGCQEACLGLLINPAARYSEADFHAMASRHGTVTEIRLILLDRADLPANTRLLLISKLGEALGSLVSDKSWLTKERAASTIGEACDKASITFAANAAEEDVDSLVKSLIDRGSMTPTFLLRAVCMGNITLVAKAFAELSGVSFAKVENILTKDRQSAFKSVYDRAGLPEQAYNVFRVAISTWRELLLSNSEINQARLPFIVTREVLQTYMGQQDEVVDELLVLLRKLSADTARQSAKAKSVEIVNRSSLALSAPDTEEIAIDPEGLDIFAESFAEELEVDSDVLIAGEETVPLESECIVPSEALAIYEADNDEIEDVDHFSLSQAILSPPEQVAA